MLRCTNFVKKHPSIQTDGTYENNTPYTFYKCVSVRHTNETLWEVLPISAHPLLMFSNQLKYSLTQCYEANVNNMNSSDFISKFL